MCPFVPVSPFSQTPHFDVSQLKASECPLQDRYDLCRSVADECIQVQNVLIYLLNFKQLPSDHSVGFIPLSCRVKSIISNWSLANLYPVHIAMYVVRWSSNSESTPPPRGSFALQQLVPDKIRVL